MPRLHLRLVPLVLCLGLASLPLLAQSQATTGVISGFVSDANGGALPGASVAVKNLNTNFEQTVATDPQGRFRVGLLPLGPYRVTVTLQGFRTLVREGLTLEVGATINLSLQLELATVTQEVKVTAQAPVIETARTEASTRIDQNAVESLPNNGRNFLDFTKLTPGVTTVQGPDGDELSINGQKGIQNNVSVDGADFNNPFFGEQRGGQRPAFTFNLDAVQEVVVVADGANAEFGRSSSGFVNVITKSGTNDAHGSGHFYYKDHNLSARPENADGSKQPEFDSSQYQVGATFGGPIRRDSLFFFLSADYQNADQTKQTDPTRIEQRVVDAFAGLGSPNENLPIDRTNDAKVFLAKFDWQLNTTNLATFRYNYTWADQGNGTFDVDSWGRSANADERDDSHSVTGSFLSTFSANTNNEFRGQWAREDRPRAYNGPDITGQNRPLPDTAFDFARAYRFGEPFFIPVDYHDIRLQFNDNFTYITGAHILKAGVEYNRTEASQTFRGFANGRYIFGSTDGFLNYLANSRYVECSGGGSSQTGQCPAGQSITGPVLLYLQFAGVGGRTADEAGTQTIRQTEPAVFLQDTWQPTSYLTISAGLRWEAQIEPDVLTPPNEVFFSKFIGTTKNGQKFPSNGEIPSDYKLWQPRFGFAWDATKDGKTVVRGSAGLFYARVPGLVFASTRSTNGSIGQTIAAASFFGNLPAYPNIIPQSQLPTTPNHPDVFVTSENFQNPRTTSVSVGVDREITPGIAATLKYNQSKTTHLTRFVNRNAAELGSPWSSGLGADGTNGITTLTSVESTANSRYWGWTVGFDKRFDNHYGFQVYYTYSKDKSDDDNERDPFSFRYAAIHEDPSDPTAEFSREWGYSDRDQRHRVNAWFLYRTPGDVDVNFRYAYRSAQPLDVKADGTPTGTPQDRINPDGTVTRRNQGQKDNQYNSLDIRIARPFLISAVTIEPSIDIFNVFNSKNLRRPQVTNLIFNFDGTVQAGVGDPRQVQLGVRVLF
jgi:outer membrane receptor protein involved in Fe transport